VIELIHGLLDFSWRHGCPVPVLRKVLSDEAIGILVQPTFPEGLRMREVDTGIKVAGHAFRVGEFPIDVA